jgi:hypothetical protein
MKNVTKLEMELLNQIKFFIENEFDSSAYMWMYTEYLKGDMKVNRALISSLIQKDIILMEGYEEENDAIRVRDIYFQVDNNDIANFINLSVK